MSKDLSLVENVNALELFSNASNLDGLLSGITDEAKSIIPDLTTQKGRNEIASMAHKVAISKVYLDGLRKDLVLEWKTKAKAVDTEGKRMRDTLDALKLEVRQPLTEWEEKEESRVKAHESNISAMRVFGEEASNNWIEMSFELITESLSKIESESIDSYEEFSSVAAGVKDNAVKLIKEAIVKREAYDKEQAELEKLRAEVAEREQKDAEEKLRLEGEKRAKLEADAAAKDEAIRVEYQQKEAKRIANEKAALAEKEKQDAINAKIEAEKRALDAEKNAKIEVGKAAQAEREKIEQERINEELAAKKREANKTHKKKINNAVLDAFVLTGMNKSQAQKAVTAIAKGEIPYTVISY